MPMTPEDAWQGFIGSQSVQEFLEISRERGYHTPEEAVSAYLDESYGDLTADIEDPISREELESLLLRYIERTLS